MTCTFPAGTPIAAKPRAAAAGGNGDGVGLFVDSFLAKSVPLIGNCPVDTPEAELLRDDLLLVALVGGTKVAEEDAAALLDALSGEQTGAGDGDQGVAGGDAFVRPTIEGEGVRIAEMVGRPRPVNTGCGGAGTPAHGSTEMFRPCCAVVSRLRRDQGQVE